MSAELKLAIDTLAGKCDGAFEKDEQGFNRFDAPLGHKLAATLAEKWTPRQARAAWHLLRKYSAQLAAAGIDYNAIPEPPKPEGQPAPKREIKLSGDGKSFVVRFEYDAALVGAVKALENGRRFDSATKSWTLPARMNAVEPLFAFGQEYEFEFSALALSKMAELVEAYANNVQASRAESAEIEISGLGGELRPFQKAGVAYALNARRCFIADEMGLGKTIEALATIHAAQAFPAIVVCPASLKLNWEREARRWLPGRSVAVWNGKAAQNQPADIVVINYDVLKKNFDALQALGAKAIILDESHYIKNYKAQRTEAAKELAKGVEYRLALTGTPVLNRPQELISQLGAIGRLNDVGGDFWSFAKRYCGAYRDRFGWNFGGAAHLDELNEKMRASCYIRRDKANVLKELPAKQRATVPVDISNRREYERAEKALIAWLRERATEDAEFLASIKDLPEAEQKERKAERADDAAQRAQKAEQLVRIEALKQLSARGKLDAISDWIESFLDTGEKLVLFAHHIEIVEALAEKFNAPSITGATPVEKRQEYVDRFQNDPECKLIVLNIRAGGVGLTLTAASNVAFVELDWTPAAHDQAEDRCHRIGQTDNVTAWYLLGSETIDEEIAALIERKRGIVTAATDGSVEANVSVMNELIGKLTGKGGE